VLAPASEERGALEFNATSGWLRRGDLEVPLTGTEFRLLAELAAHLGQVLSRQQLLQRVWEYDHFGDVRLVDVTVRRLRVKLEPDPAQPVHLVTLRGRGYRLQATT
jgi:DNA-binding response OmpR family regulator